ncbi:uncharacterized protein BDW70DRAFT_164206 [Aspergillus foveolatus]|uniref:uncharacterized protein n=1 Tax=Aspergillus foveolatus TaxID=210207 RepID=UPI003CCD6E84
MEQQLERRLTDNADEDVGIDDPFRGKTMQDVENDVRAFYAELPELRSVVDIDLLIKGAQIAKDSNARSEMQLSKIERDVLRQEQKFNLHGITEILQQMEGLRVTILTTACAAVALGWQQSAINTSAQTWPYRFCLHPYSWKAALINAVPSLSGSIIGTWVSDPLQGVTLKTPAILKNFHLGRRFAMMLSGFVSVICCIWSARCESWQELLICRVILGFSIGTKASVAPIFAAEAAMEKSRGRILMMWQLFDAFGIMLGFMTALIAPHSWQVQLAAPLIPSVALMLLAILSPESPRLLIRTKRYGDAYKCLRRLRRLEIQAARDFYFIHVQLQREVNVWRRQRVGPVPSANFDYQEWVERQNTFKRMLYLITLPRNRRTCLVSFLVMLSQQACGINVLAYYSSIIFQDPKALTQANFLSFGFGAANFVFTLPSFFLIDEKGRRFILLTSFLGMAVSLLGASFCFMISEEGPRIAAVVITVIILFTGSYSIGAGPVPFTLSAEIFPLAFREVGMSFSVMVNFLFLGVLILVLPQTVSLSSFLEEECRATRSLGKVYSLPETQTEYSGSEKRNILLGFTGLNVLMGIHHF